MTQEVFVTKLINWLIIKYSLSEAIQNNQLHIK